MGSYMSRDAARIAAKGMPFACKPVKSTRRVRDHDDNAARKSRRAGHEYLWGSKYVPCWTLQRT